MNTERLDVAGVPSLQPTLFKNQIPLIASFPSNAYPALNSISGIFFFNRPCLRGVQNVIESDFDGLEQVFFFFQFLSSYYSNYFLNKLQNKTIQYIIKAKNSAIMKQHKFKDKWKEI